MERLFVFVHFVDRPWNNLPILNIDEPLVFLPSELLRIEPHPYVSLGAPYGKYQNPWQLRQDVVRRLVSAQESLIKENANLRLAIFDAWRPIAVQEFMIDYEIKKACLTRQLNPSCKDHYAQYQELLEEISLFWAPPSKDPKKPPPHSTGAAVDLTLSNKLGEPLMMGGEIDEIGEVSSPEFYKDVANDRPESEFSLWHSRRKLLAHVMFSAGFEQHPKEWWHFSFGDQLWGWKSNSNYALYGLFSPEKSI